MLSGTLGGALNRRAWDLDAIGVFTLALAGRLVELLHGGVAAGPNGYDQSVYYAAADAVTHGRVPYRGDFVFLHPPGIILTGLPFALLGRLTTAPTGFLVENIGFALLASCTAVLVVVVARRAGMPRWAAVGGGVFYASWSVTVAAGSSARLEPLGDLLFVLAVYLIGPGRDLSRRRLVLAGVMFGLLVSTKVWWVVPVGLVFLLLARGRGGIRVWSVVPLAAVVTTTLVDLPFLLLSRGHMFVSVIMVQLARKDVQITPSGDLGRLSTMVRLERLTGVEAVMSRLFGIHPEDLNPSVPLITIVVCALVVTTSAYALRTALGRIFVPVLAAQSLVLLTARTYYPYYGDFVGVALALVVAAAVGPVGGRLRRTAWPVGWATVAVFTLVPLLATRPNVFARHPPDGEALARATRNIPCVVADTPWALIDMNALDRSFEDGCRNWIDFQGVSHGGGADPAAYVLGTEATAAWKRVVHDYLASGDAFALSDLRMWGLLGPARLRDLTRGQFVTQSQGILVFRTANRVAAD